MMSAKSYVRPLALMSLLCACAVLPRRASAQDAAGPRQRQEERDRLQRQLEEINQQELRHYQERKEELDRRARDEGLGGAVIFGGWGSAASEAALARSRMAWFFGPFDAFRVESTFGLPTGAPAVRAPGGELAAPAAPPTGPSKSSGEAKLDADEYARRMAAFLRGPVGSSLERQRFLRVVEEPYLLVLAVDYEKGAPVGSSWALTRRWASFDLALEDEVGLAALRALRSGRPKHATAALPRDRFEEAYTTYRRSDPAAKRVRIETLPEATAPELFIMESLGLVLQPARSEPTGVKGLKVVGILGPLPAPAERAPASGWRAPAAQLALGDVIVEVSPWEPPGARPPETNVAEGPVLAVEREGTRVEIPAANLLEVMTLRHLLLTVQPAEPDGKPQ